MSVQTKIRTFGGNVGIGTDDPGSYRLKVHGGGTRINTLVATSLKVGTSVNAQVPSGIIAMWAGVSVPSGWFLCDGSNGTPDLRDKFILGAGGGSAQGATGGVTGATLVAGNIPEHTHTGTTVSSGGHGHTVNATANGGAHAHNANSGTGGTHGHTVNASNSSNHAHNFSTAAAGGDHAHTVNYNQSGSHSHAGGVQCVFDSTGGIYGRNPSPGGSHSLARQPGYYNTKYDLTSYGGNHRHYVSFNNNAHSHNANSNNTGDHTHAFNGTVSAGAQHNHNVTANQSGSHSHSNSNTGSGNLHSHTFTSGTTGNGTAFNFTAPYYALAYIMKE